jgi:two-component system NarL family sensor kinase
MTGKPCWCIQTFLRGKLKPKNIDVLECSRLREAVEARQEDTTEGLRYHATIPLYFRNQPLGIMNVTSPTWRRLSAEELELLSTVAYQTGIAIERARLAESEKRAARADERTRIAREIHDTLAQGLTAIGLQIEGAINTLDTDSGRARQRLERALALSRDSLEEARRSVLDLRAEPLAVPLPEAIAALGRRLTADSGVRVHVTSHDIPDLDLRTETELYRIAQEALTNVYLHSGAADVEVTLQVRRAHLQLKVRDDGRGFAAGVERDRYGILGMRERARLLGGTLKIRTAPGRGTVISVRVPLTAEPA